MLINIMSIYSDKRIGTKQRLSMLKNSTTHYGWVSIGIHWLMALSVIGMFALGLYMVELTYYDSWYRGSLDLHKSIGILLFFCLGFRIFWRLINVTPEVADKNTPKLEALSASIAHLLLYILMVILMLSGYLISTADGRSIYVFEFIEIPALTFAFENQEDIAGLIHEIIAWALIVLASVHALAALKHHFITKNNTLIRMLSIKH